MEEKKVDLSEKIARQIAEIAKESVRIDLEILQFLKEDYEEICRIAKEQGLSPAQLVIEVLKGIEKGLAAGGLASYRMIKEILEASKERLESLGKAHGD